MGTFETFEHTADLGLAVRGESLADLLETAARAVFSVMLVDWPEEVETDREVRVERPPGPEGVKDLLVRWLQELLYHFEAHRGAPLTFDFHEAGPLVLCATVGFGRFDPERHRTGLEIKAVTYHGLEVRRDKAGWSARFILDV